MISRNNIVFALMATLAVAAAVGFGLMALRLGGDCMSTSGGGSCPTLAEVNGVRYSVSVARGIVATDDDVTSYAPIAQTNSPALFAELMAYQLEGISPSALLVAPATQATEEDDSPYRILWGPDSSSGFPEACRFLSAAEQRLFEQCRGTPAGS